MGHPWCTTRRRRPGPRRPLVREGAVPDGPGTRRHLGWFRVRLRPGARAGERGASVDTRFPPPIRVDGGVHRRSRRGPDAATAVGRATETAHRRHPLGRSRRELPVGTLSAARCGRGSALPDLRAPSGQGREECMVSGWTGLDRRRGLVQALSRRPLVNRCHGRDHPRHSPCRRRRHARTVDESA